MHGEILLVFIAYAPPERMDTNSDDIT